MRTISVSELIKNTNLEIISGEKGINGLIKTDMVCHPGMEFAGFFDYYDEQRVIIIGSKEIKYLLTRNINTQKERVEKIFAKNPPAVIYSLNVELPQYFVEFSNKYNVPLLKSNMITDAISSKVYVYLQSKIAPIISVHATLLDINGIGTLIIGKSGIGKSETAMELIKKGHQLVADDLVEIYEKEPGNLIGYAPDILRRYLEIRGIGIVDVVHMFGSQAYSHQKSVRLVVELEKWSEENTYDRIGLENKTIKYFDTEITHVVLPILPGRNVASLVECAANNEKLKYLGYNSALEFTKTVNNLVKGGKKND